MSTKIIKKLLFITLMLLTGSGAAVAQEQGAAQQPAPSSHHEPAVLQQYIQEAFDNNQGLQQQHFSLEKSLYALQEAKALFLPQVSLLGSYTKAGGGRTIDIPVGDLMNPVYQTLNQLTGSTKFPQLSNQSVLLNPDNFYDARLRTSLPLVNTEIWYARKIRQEGITLQQAAVNVYKRRLVKDVKTAYFQYYQACRAVDIYRNALVLVQENIRVNTSFLENGVRNSTALTRAQTEQQRIQASITRAENNRQNAQAYFNFLLNKPLNAAITLDSAAFAPSAALPVQEEAGRQREELTQLEQNRKIAGLQYRQQQSYLVPKLSTFLDLGSQDFNWQVNSKSRYYLWGLNLQWDLFAGGQRKYKARQAAADMRTAEAAYHETTSALELEASNARSNYRTALANYGNAQTQLQLAEKYYRDQLKVYKAGQLLYLELLDAQQQLTNARLELSVAFAQVQTAAADVERALALYPLGK